MIKQESLNHEISGKKGANDLRSLHLQVLVSNSMVDQEGNMLSCRRNLI